MPDTARDIPACQGYQCRRFGGWMGIGITISPESAVMTKSTAADKEAIRQARGAFAAI